MRKKQPEYELQAQVCEYLCRQYPNVDFLSDMRGSVKLTMGQAARNKRIQKPNYHGPDLLILEPRGGYHGLFIELKAESPYKKDGTLKANEHVQKQFETIRRLNQNNYCACVKWEFDAVKDLIDWYMKLEKS